MSQQSRYNLADVENYFTQKLREHGATPQGLDFNSEESQIIRFQQFARALDFSRPFTLIDYGCGYGALAKYLTDLKLPLKSYTGYDISRTILDAAALPHDLERKLTASRDMIGQADFTVASGIFNVKLGSSERDWRNIILDDLQVIARSARRGFAFNMLTSYSDQEKMRDDLYYGDPCWFFDYCKKTFGPNVVLFHDYGLYDWTMAVRLDRITGPD